MMSRRWIARLLRIGVTPEMSPSDTRSVTLSNFIAFVGILMTLLGGVATILSQYAGLAVSIGSCLTLGLVPLANHRGAWRAGGLILVAGATGATAVQALRVGAASNVYQFLLPTIIFPFFVFPSGASRAALVASAATALCFVGIVVVYSLSPWRAAPVYGEEVYVLVGAMMVVMVTITGAYTRVLASAAEAAIARARQRSEEILDNVLPARVAARLRSGETELTEDFAEVTILYADIAGFTPLAETMSPEALVRLLDELVSSFDRLCAQYEVEKIKTIGDAYVAAAGLMEPRGGGAQRMVSLGREMLALLKEMRARTGQAIDIRIGIASGPVVAGVVGKHKFSFEVWGEAVTIAEQLEAEGVAGSMLISEPVRSQLGDNWQCRPHAPLMARGREIAAYVVLPQ
jgi:adenylate cyclase